MTIEVTPRMMAAGAKAAFDGPWPDNVKAIYIAMHEAASLRSVILGIAAASDEAIAREADWNAVLAGTATPEQREAAISYAATCAGWPTTPSPDASPDSGELAALVQPLFDKRWASADGEWGVPSWTETDEPRRIGEHILALRPSPSPAIVKEAGEVERRRGQEEGFAAAVAQLRDMSAIKPRATLYREAGILADHLEQSRVALSASNAAQVSK